MVYKDRQSVKNLRSDGKTTVLYAKWAKKTYTVAFNANGGKGKMPPQTVTYGKTVKLAKNTFAFDGSVLLGWATSKGGKVVYKNAQAVKNLRTDGKATVLYAKWAKKNYTVAFNANGGKGKMAAQKMTYGKAAKLRKNAFKRSGWTFLGWAKTKNGAVAYQNAQAVKNLRTDGKTTTLYAVWAKNVYKVAFKANGGSGSMAAQKMAYGKAANLRKNAFKRTGYTFAGWAKTATGAVAYKNAQAVKNLRTDGGTTTLYAKWKFDRYAVVLDPQGGEGGTAGVTATYGGALPDIAVPERKGWVFEGYFAATSGGGTQYYADSGESLRDWDRTAGATLFAHWSGPVLFVDAANGDDANDGLLWRTAKASIQSAIDIAEDGTCILVADGVYEPVATVDETLYPDGKELEIVSVNGAEATIIDGSGSEACDHVALLGMPDSDGELFAWKMSVLDGFTLRGGHPTNGFYAIGAGAFGGILRNCIVTDNRTDGAGGGVGFAICEGCVISGNKSSEWHGGGAFNCYLTNCIVENNEAAVFGGGTIGGTLVRCIVRGNRSGGDGGGVYASDLENCLVCGNSAETGGGIACETNGVYTNAIVNCTIAGNTATYEGGGITGPGQVFNSIVWGNSAPEAPEMEDCTARFVCSPDVSPENGNITGNPLFVDAAAGDFTLRSDSPCLDAGSDALARGDRDLAGNARIVGPAVDMGAYEHGAVAPKDTASGKKGTKRAGSALVVEESDWVAVTTSDKSDGAAVSDGDETTSWMPGTTDGSWVVLTLSSLCTVEDVEVIGENLPEGTRFLLSEDADHWQKGVPGKAQYVWVVFPAGDVPPVVREIRVLPEK
ncbi:MAG: InlB B-repeat-containing protein [Kiritimatiellae bacterium]|nr:InlB B-repeat-containing protein [Kiritimatiellia bacterium]